MRGTPRWLIMLGGVLGIALVITGLAGAGLAAGEMLSAGQITRATSWAVIFELSIALSGVFAAMLLFGKFKSGPCMTMLVAGGCAMLGVPLMDLSIATGLIGRGSDFLTFSGVSSMTIAITNLVPALGLITLAGLGTLLRKPAATLPRFIIGCGLLLVLPALYLLVGVPSVSLGTGPVGVVLTALTWTVLLAVLLIVISVGAHLVARAIEIGIETGMPKQADGNEA